MKRNKTRQPRPVYRIENKGRRWTLLTPDGRPFVSLGVTHTGAAGSLRHGQAGREAVVRRMVAHLREWGFNTAGYQHPAEIREQMPFIADTNLVAIPYFMSKPRYPDVFGGYARVMHRLVHEMCAEAKSNPNLIGYYWTDTPRLDLDTARRLVNDDWVSAIRRNPAIFPGKRRYVAFLRERHAGSPERFRNLYGLRLEDPELLESDFSHLKLDDPPIHRDDYEFLRLIAREYYRGAGEAMEREDRKHLVFGDRYMLSDLPTEVLEEAMPWIDVVAVQSEELRFERELFDRIYRIARKPILICDHTIGFSAGQPGHPGQCATEAEAARACERYLSEAFATPYIVGYHRSYMDRFSKSRGRIMQGLMREDGSIYETLVEGTTRASRAVLTTLSEGNPTARSPHL
jgi:hypothetical protein